MGKLEEAANQQLQTEFEDRRLKAMKGLIVDRKRAEDALATINKRINDIEVADTQDKWAELPQYSGERY